VVMKLLGREINLGCLELQSEMTHHSVKRCQHGVFDNAVAMGAVCTVPVLAAFQVLEADEEILKARYLRG